ncbi:20481_t:CDS:2 [Funneliformis geosporum]|nr:20481_t:CDS:2 [Funneliformis geosporum]
MFSPLEIITQHLYVPYQSIKVTEIPLDATEHRIKMIFSKFGKIVRFFMEIKNLWQQATITYSNDTDFKTLKNKYRVFVLNYMSPYGKQLADIGHIVNAISWIIPKA